MRTLVLAACMLGLAASGAAADGRPVAREGYRAKPVAHVVSRPRPVADRNARGYDWCEARSARLTQFEGRVQRDGRVSVDELRIASALRADLAGSCRGPWVPTRVWYHR